jgi:UDP-N-acetylglucosamine--N-acetylmuramyl-(pentapeptide) pyrophosphoryl-undecaprenol N-acetylglucosamine transferase
MKVVIAGGGTAGHVNPALALARSLEGDEVSFLGTSRGAEARLVPEAGYELHEIDVRGFDRSRPLSIFPTGGRALAAVFATRKKLKELHPQVVVGMGGYVSLPAAAAARSLRVPIVLHEQNIVFGLSNRVSKGAARSVAVSFEETLEEAGPRGVLTGNPVSPDLIDFDPDRAREAALTRWELDSGKRTLLVFGGSQGARSVNLAAAELASLWASRSDLQILHVTGRSAYEEIRERVAAADNPDYKVVDYVSPMSDAYAVADLALCRGGATTVAELGVVGLPALIVPYPYHRDRQQEKHGRALEVAGAAIVIVDAEATGERVALEADKILGNAERLGAMANAAKRFGRPDAGERLAEVVRRAAA